MAELTDQNALDRINRAVQELGPAKDDPGDGRGIVICAGGPRYFICAWVCINMLRKLGCTLPIELWHLGPAEMKPPMRKLIEPLGVSCVDAHEVRKLHPARTLNGWEVKPYAIIHSSFREVISLDADNVPLVDPEFLFDTPEYRQHGALFWPDYGRLQSNRMIWALAGVPYRDEPEFESGQIVVDKSRCRQPLALAMWMNEHSDFWYRHVHGDKDTFHVAWRKLGQPYAMPRRGIHSLSCTMCQHDFQDNRIFQHRNLAKWTLRGNRRISGFEREEECLSFIDSLISGWSEIGGVSIYSEANRNPEERAVAERLIGHQWIYERVGHDRRPMNFAADGTIAQGAAGLEVFWDIRGNNDRVMLDIQSHDSLTCRLVGDKDGVWRGRWEQFEKMPVELWPDSPIVSTTPCSLIGAAPDVPANGKAASSQNNAL